MAPEVPLIFWLSPVAPVSISLSELHVSLGCTAALSAFILSGRDRQSPQGQAGTSQQLTAPTKLIFAYPKPWRSSRIPVQMN